MKINASSNQADGGWGMLVVDDGHDRSFLTPLGAAIVEALPDRELVDRINRRFKRTGACPPSKLFDANAVAVFYRRVT